MNKTEKKLKDPAVLETEVLFFCIRDNTFWHRTWNASENVTKEDCLRFGLPLAEKFASVEDRRQYRVIGSRPNRVMVKEQAK